MLARSLPYMSRPHAWLELQAWTLQAVPSGVLAGGVAGVLVNSVFAGEVQAWVLAVAVALATGAGPFGYVTSIAWSLWSQGRDKVGALIRLKGLFAVSLLLVACVPVSGLGLALLVASLLGGGILWCGIITVRSIVWRTNYGRAARTVFAARAQVLVSIVMSLVGAGAGLALDASVGSFRWIFVLAAGCALAALFAYRRVRVRHQRRILSGEREHADGGPFRASRLWRVLRSDPLYRRYMTWMFVTGSGNLMAIAPLILILTDHLQMPNFTQVMITASVPTLLIPLTTPVWARVLAERHAIAFRALNSRYFIAVSAAALAGVTLQWEPPAVAFGDLPGHRFRRRTAGLVAGAQRFRAAGAQCRIHGCTRDAHRDPGPDRTARGRGAVRSAGGDAARSGRVVDGTAAGAHHRGRGGVSLPASELGAR